MKKAKVYFNGLEVCEVLFDFKRGREDGGVNFNNYITEGKEEYETVAYFSKEYAFVLCP